MSAEPQAELQVPVVELEGVRLAVGERPDGLKQLIIGPLVLVLPLTPEGAELVSGALASSVQVARAADLAKLPKMAPSLKTKH